MNLSQKAIFSLLFSPVLVSPSYSSNSASSLPNIVVIFADDFGYGDLSCYGAEKIITPEVDRLASAGIRFTNGYVASSLCSPSRYSLLTGRYSWRTHLKSGVLKTFAPPLIEKDRMTLPAMLKQNGYYTACVGKWHLGFDWALLDNAPDDAEESVFNTWGPEPHKYIDFTKPVSGGPVERGFDYFFGISGANNMMPFIYLENDKVVEPPSIPNNFGTNVLRATNWDLRTLDQTFTHKAVEVINHHFSHRTETPIFLYFPTSAIHRPCLPTFTKGQSQAGNRGDVVLEFDWMVGQIVKALKENDALDNTLIIVTSDNGPQPGDPYNLIQRFKNNAMGDEYDYYEPYFSEFQPEYLGNGGVEAGWLTYGHSPTAGLMGFKSDAWEGGLRVPFIIHWPDKIKQGRVDDTVICTVDIMATIAEIIGVETEPDTAEDSYSFLYNILDENANPYRNTLTMVSGRTGALVIRKGDWKYLDGVDMETWDQNQTYNPNEYPGAPDFRKSQLYNLKTDVYERNDLLVQMPEKVNELKGIIEKVKSGNFKENWQLDWQQSEIRVNGLIGEAVYSSEHGRLQALPNWNNGELIKTFSPESRKENKTNDWYGEHAGKWMYTAARAVHRSGNTQLKELLHNTADHIVSWQEPDGYIGTYSHSNRLTNNEAATHATSWDVWNHSYIVLGLLEVNHYFPNKKYLAAALKVGELFLELFSEGKQNVTGYGTRRGISATVILDPLVELYKVSNDQRYLNLAYHIIKQMEAKEGLMLISALLANRPLENIGDGKAYQMLWNLTAIAKIYQIDGNKDFLQALENAWNMINRYHLSITGGPWGGIGKHKECFNSRNFWSPYGYIETCSIMAWIQFNREMLKITGEAKYAQAIETSAYNALLGARYQNGTDWCYHSFTNGCTHTAHFNDCCPSSGALALEELPPLVYTIKENGIACNLYAESEATFVLSENNEISISQHTSFPFDGDVSITINPENETFFPLFVRIPDWANNTIIRINGIEFGNNEVTSGAYLAIRRNWNYGDKIDIHFPMELKVETIKEISFAPQQGGPMYEVEWFALQRGPLVYSVSGLIDGLHREFAYPLPLSDPESFFFPVETKGGGDGQAYELRIPEHEPLIFKPYFEAADQTTGKWRLTWVVREII